MDHKDYMRRALELAEATGLRTERPRLMAPACGGFERSEAVARYSFWRVAKNKTVPLPSADSFSS